MFGPNLPLKLHQIHVEIVLGSSDIRMAQELANMYDVHSVDEQMGGCCAPQAVGLNWLKAISP